MMHLHTEIAIAAPPERVWAVLTDFAVYAEWNPFVRRVSGRLALGERLTVRQEPPGRIGRTSRPVVTRLEPGVGFAWTGTLGGRALFWGEHAFWAQPDGAGGTRFVQEEDFGGLLLPVVWWSLSTHTRAGFVAMNRALKARVEG